MNKAVLAILAAMIVPALSARAIAAEEMVYKKVGDRELKLHVFKPADWKAEDRRPAIVFFFGGGWVGGTPSQFDEQCKYLSSRGMVAMEAEYRLLRKTGKEPPLVCIQDARSSIRFVRSHAARLGVDPDRIASAGGSAGGHLAACLGMMDSLDDPQDDLKVSARSNAMVLFNPVFDNGPGGWGYSRTGERYKEFSPFHNVTAKAAPAIVFLGSRDALIPVKTLEQFKAAMEKAGVRCETRVYEGQSHGFFNYGRGDNRYYLLTLKATDEFLTSLGWLKGPPALTVPGEDDRKTGPPASSGKGP